MADRRARLGPAFGALWWGSGVSNLGDGMRLAALPLLAVQLTSSPLLIAGVATAQYLPWLLFAPVGPIAWFFAGRQRGQLNGRRGPTYTSAPRGPDDDPDFLRNL